jgi:hypothetical protein
MKKRTYNILTVIPFMKYLLSAAGIEEFKLCSQACIDFKIDKIREFEFKNPDVLITPKVAMKILKTR